MKNIVFILTVIIAGFLFVNFNIHDGDKPSSKGNSVEIPDDVQTVLDNSCWGCHNTESKNLKAKKKLSFDKLSKLKIYKVVGKLTDIQEVIMEEEMPPKKFLKKYPDHALNDEGKELLLGWAKQNAKKIAGE
jgi:hypothetical protein